jgi:periplasmic protein TonB
MVSQKEKNNKVIAAASTLGMYAVLFFILLFTIAWKAPYPPLGGRGDELILGFDDSGYGETPDDPIGTQEPDQQKEEMLKQEEQAKEEVKPQPEEEEDKEVVTSTEESPVTVKKEEPKKEEKKKEEKKEVVKPVEPKKEEPKKEEPKKEEPKVYNPSKNTATSDNKEGTPGSKGDEKGTTGDKGDPRGTPTGKVYEGNPGTGGGGKGGSGGIDLQMAGWEWVEKPIAPKASEEDQFSGEVTFSFVVDDIGKVGDIKKVSGNLRNDLEQKCREALRNTSFYKTSTGDAPEETRGRITFRLRVQ